MNLLFLFGIFVFLLIFTLSIFPRLIWAYTKKLFVYHACRNNKELWKKIKKVMHVYIMFGFGVGLLFSVIFNINPQTLRQVSNINPYAFSVSISLIFVWALRVCTLLDKTELFNKLKLIPEFFKPLIKKANQNYSWCEQRNEMRSLLFSLLLLTIISGIIYVLFTKIVFVNTQSVFSYEYIVTFSLFVSLLKYLIFIFLGVFILSILGEIILYKVGVHNDCIDKMND